MSNYIKLLAFVSVSIFVLSACTNNVGLEAGDSVDVTDQSEIITDLDSSPSVSRFGNNMSCDLLQGKEAREMCVIQINEMIGSMLVSDIYTTFNKERCKELPQMIAVECEQYLMNTGVVGPISEQELSLYNKIIAGTYAEPGDTSVVGQPNLVFEIDRCSELKTTGLSEFCKKQVNQRINQRKFEEIIAGGDATKCEDLEGSLIESCNSFFNVDIADEQISPSEGEFIPEAIPVVE